MLFDCKYNPEYPVTNEDMTISTYALDTTKTPNNKKVEP